MSSANILPDGVRAQIDSARTRFLAIGVVGVIATIGAAAAMKDWTQFFQSYLFAYVYWMTFAMGCLAFLQLHHMTGGKWGLPLRRILEAGTRTIPLMSVLFLPLLLLGIKRLYPWATDSDVIGHEPSDHFRQLWLQPGFFIFRAIVYLAVFNLLAFLLNKWSAEQDRTADLRLKDKMTALAAPGVILWSLAWSWAMLDWIMSLEAKWFSSIYGLVFMVISLLSAVSFSVIMLRMLDNYQPLHDSYDPPRLNDIGNFMLVFTLLWTYMSFAQFLIIWSGNLKQEIPWYKVRAFTSWGYVAAALLILHFFVPFFILLQRRVKRKLQRLSIVAFWMLVISLIDVYWLIVPSFPGQQSAPHVHLLDVLALVGIGGVWIGAYMAQLKKMPLLPLHDPRFEGVLEHSHGD
jgi:hypothetical protein